MGFVLGVAVTLWVLYLTVSAHPSMVTGVLPWNDPAPANPQLRQVQEQCLRLVARNRQAVVARGYSLAALDAQKVEILRSLYFIMLGGDMLEGKQPVPQTIFIFPEQCDPNLVPNPTYGVAARR